MGSRGRWWQKRVDNSEGRIPMSDSEGDSGGGNVRGRLEIQLNITSGPRGPGSKPLFMFTHRAFTLLDVPGRHYPVVPLALRTRGRLNG